MPVSIVNLHIRQECLDAFLEAVQANHEASVAEVGNRRFDVLQSTDDPTRFVLYEWYDTPEQAQAHRLTAHFDRWRRTIEPMLASPRTAAAFEGLWPKRFPDSR